ncbi:hypothetical protein E1A91_A04G121400v1 [Gossypium mustelinum]|uniref:Uncharacterized protein n=1 Tax=Gossypium mustelinum TaxID=34275 RepID=A0A5D2ZRD4_GOSMU|nr:hypothetical protein E1A91_A04G121400v1 [Gossypium mustelinum]
MGPVTRQPRLPPDRRRQPPHRGRKSKNRPLFFKRVVGGRAVRVVEARGDG